MEAKPFIAITAYNRSEVLEESMNRHALNSQGIDIFIHYDDPDDRIGIPASKNACLREFMAGDYTHCFLFDDDTYPIHEDWHKAYINSGLQHACYTFYPPKRRHKTHNEYKLANGCMIMVTRKCVELAGGFDEDFGLGKYEHKEYDERIHAWGLTPCKFLDIPGSNRYIYCADQNSAHVRSMSKVEMDYLINKNHAVYLDKVKKLRRFVKY